VKILYVEDESITRMVMKKQLNIHFEEVLTAENGAEGFECFKEHSPDVIITDIAMPVMNGYELIKAIRETDKDIQIIVTSAFYDDDYDDDNIRLVKKPVLVSELVSSIKETVSYKSM